MKKLLYILLFVPLFGVSQSLPQVGDYFQGGVVFWINPDDNNKGLICNIFNEGGYTWGCWSKLLGI